MTQWIAPTKMSKEIAHGLQWLQRQSEFDRDHRAIMLACSREKYLWTSYSTLAKRSGLDSEVLEKELKYLDGTVITTSEDWVAGASIRDSSYQSVNLEYANLQSVNFT